MQLSPEEIIGLNSMLAYIPYRDRFDVFSIYCNNILKLQYPRDGGGVDLAKYGEAQNRLVQQKFFTNIISYLIEKNFVIISDPVKRLAKVYNNDTQVEFTDYGRVLKVFGRIEAYDNAHPNSNEEQIKQRIPRVIQKAHIYGPFKLKCDAIFSIYDNISKAEIDRVKQCFVELLEDNEMLSYLIKEGFAIYRYDYQPGDNFAYFQLTDRGRKLKELGSIDLFNQYWTNEEQLKNLLNQTVIRNYWVNLCIAIATSVAAIYYGYSLFDYYDKHTLNIKYFEYFLSGFVTAAIVFIIFTLIRSRQKKTR